MKQYLLLIFLLCSTAVSAKTGTYNQSEIINMRDQGFPADERETNVLRVQGNRVYGVTSGDRCHAFELDTQTKKIRILATIEGPNTVLKGMVLDGDTLYFGTMLSKRQLWLKARKVDPDFEPEEVNLLEIDDSDHTGHLYRITRIHSSAPHLEDLGVPVPGQGIHTLAYDATRKLVYGVTAPLGRFFVYDTESGETESLSFGTTLTTVSNHMVGFAEVTKELADLIPGEGEWNNRLIPQAMFVTDEGILYTSGWNGKILRYDPDVDDPNKRFTEVSWIPSVPGRQYWNRIDAITADGETLYLGTSDGYILRFYPKTGELENLGKPIRAIEVKGMAISPLDGNLYGVSGGGLEGMSRPWVCDPRRGTFEVDIPALPVFVNRHPVGDLVCTEEGTLVFAEADRVANLHLLMPGEKKGWEKSGILPEENPGESRAKPAPEGRFEGHKQVEVQFFPIPSTLHGGSGYTAIQADREGRIYVGTAYYGKRGELVQLDPKTAQWRSLFKTDYLTHQFGRGQGIPGKIHTKLRLGKDGKIYGAMKQGYELQYTLRPDIGEAPEGVRGSQFTCHYFSYDPETEETVDLGPTLLQEGVTSLAVDTDRGYLYGATVPGVRFQVVDLERGRIWTAGAMAHPHPQRYMPKDPGTGRVYHPGEVTPEGRVFMTVWDPDEFRLRDVEVVTDEGIEKYSHSYATCCGPAGSHTLYGCTGDSFFEMNLDDTQDGKFHVRRLCYVGVDGDEQNSGLYAIERGPDGKIYWASIGGRNIPIDLFSWDPKTETKTYLGSPALAGEWFKGGHVQGLCLDSQGNLALHVLYAEPTEKQRKQWRVPEDFVYEDIGHQPYVVGYPGHIKGTYYSVFYLPNATEIQP